MTRCEKHGERLVPATMAAYQVFTLDLETKRAETRIVPEHKIWVCLSCVVENHEEPTVEQPS